MSDAEWAVVRDAMPVRGWLEGRGGQPKGFCHRQMLDAVRYLVAAGVAWRAMSAGFPAWDRVYAFFRHWRHKGLVAEFHDRLRDRVREAAGRVDGAAPAVLGGDPCSEVAAEDRRASASTWPGPGRTSGGRSGR
ncbi:transposase [Streptomyces sp. NPDC054945]